MTLLPISAKRLARESAFVQQHASQFGKSDAKFLWIEQWAWCELMAGRLPTGASPPTELPQVPVLPCNGCGGGNAVKSVATARTPQEVEQALMDA